MVVFYGHVYGGLALFVFHEGVCPQLLQRPREIYQIIQARQVQGCVPHRILAIQVLR